MPRYDDLYAVPVRDLARRLRVSRQAVPSRFSPLNSEKRCGLLCFRAVDLIIHARQRGTLTRADLAGILDTDNAPREPFYLGPDAEALGRELISSLTRDERDVWERELAPALSQGLTQGLWGAAHLANKDSFVRQAAIHPAVVRGLVTDGKNGSVVADRSFLPVGDPGALGHFCVALWQANRSAEPDLHLPFAA